MNLLLQTAGSLVAILALSGLAWWLRLGGTSRLASEADVSRAANEVEDGFCPVAAACDADGAAALARDAGGRIMLIRRHGNRFAGRVLGPAATARFDDARLVVDPGETRFGTVSLELADAQAWAEAINQVSISHNA